VQVTTASNFEDAKNLLETQTFDLAVLDIMGVDGYGLLRIANRKKIPAAMLTAHAFNPPNLVKSIKEGAAAYIPKEEITRIADFLNDVLLAKATGKDPWGAWQDRLPTSFLINGGARPGGTRTRNSGRPSGKASKPNAANRFTTRHGELREELLFVGRYRQTEMICSRGINRLDGGKFYWRVFPPIGTSR
jgi:hypothetical protein